MRSDPRPAPRPRPRSVVLAAAVVLTSVLVPGIAGATHGDARGTSIVCPPPGQDSSPDAFDDDDGNVHEANINKLANAGIVQGTSATTYEPDGKVSRAQMATFVAQGIDFANDEAVDGDQPPAPSRDWFVDDAGNVHETNINRLHEQLIVVGTGGNQYDPGLEVSRAQMATFDMQGADYLGEIEAWAPILQRFRISPTTDTNQVSANHTVTVTFLDANDDPIVDASVDVFVVPDTNPFEADGTCNLKPSGDVDSGSNSTGSTACTIDANDPLTDQNGEVTFTYSSSPKDVTDRIIAFTAPQGTEYDDDARPEFDASATKTWVSDIQGLDAAPETDQSPYGADHRVTAWLDEDTNNDDDEAGDAIPLPGETIVVEVYRQLANAPDACTEADPDTNSSAGGLQPVSGQQVETFTRTTPSDGRVSVTYTGPDDPSAQEGDTTVDCIFAFRDANGDGERQADEVSDVVQMTWSDAAPTAQTLTLIPDRDTNLASTAETTSSHTVTATVRDQFGDPVETTVTFEVHRQGAVSNPVQTGNRTTGADGEVTFTYPGPSNHVDDVVLACVDNDDPANGCDYTVAFAATGVSGDRTVSDDDAGEVSDEALKLWVEEADPDFDDVTDSTVVGFDTEVNFVDIEITNSADLDQGDQHRYRYDNEDQFFVACGATADGTTEATTAETADAAQFESALTVGEDIDANDYNPGGVSQFFIDDADNSSTKCQ